MVTAEAMLPGHAGEVAGDPCAGGCDGVLDGGGRIRRQLGILQPRLELRCAVVHLRHHLAPYGRNAEDHERDDRASQQHR